MSKSASPSSSKPSISGAASSWSPYIAAVKRADAAQRQLSEDSKRFAQQQQAVNKGAASSWNPYISAVQRARLEQQKLADEQKQQAAQMAARAKPLNGSGAASTWNPHVAAQQKQADLQNAGLAMTAMGVGGGALLYKSAQDAGQVERVRGSFKTSLGGDEAKADALLAKVSELDGRLQGDFLSAAQSAAVLLDRGFSAEEIPRMLEALGNASASKENPAESMKLAAIQLAQVKGKGKIAVSDANALSEGGGLPVQQIFQEAFGKARTAKWQSGDETITSDEAVPAILKWVEKNRGKAMDNALETLPGQINAFQSELFKLSATVGNDLIPSLKVGISFLRALTGFLNAIPAPIRKVLVGAGVLTIALATLGGVFITASIGARGLTSALGLKGAAASLATLRISGLATTISGALAPALSGLAGIFSLTLLPAIAAIALTATAAAATISAIKWTKEAATKSDEEMEGKNSSFRQRTVSQAGRGLASFFGRDETATGDAAEKKSAELYAKLRKKALSRPTPAATTNALNTAAAARGTNSQALSNINSGAAAAYAGSLPGVSMVSSVDDLQERLMLSEDKGEKKQLSRQLFYARRNERNQKASARASERERKAMEREAKKEETARKREAKHQEVEARKEARAKHALQERIENSLSAQEIAQLKAQTDVRIAALRAQKRSGRGFQGQNAAIDYQISLLKAEETEKAASIKASHDDRFAEFGGQNIAAMRSQALRQGARFKFDGALADAPSDSGISGIRDELRNGQSIFEISRRRKNQAIDFGSGEVLRDVSRETTSIDVPIRNRVSQDAMATILSTFTPIRCAIPNPLRGGGR